MLAAVRALGGDVKLTDNGRLKVVAPAPLPNELIRQLRAAKADLLTLLSSPKRQTEPRDSWPDGEEERAAIVEYDTGARGVLQTSAQPYDSALAALRSRSPQLVEADRWQQAVRDAESFLAKWGAQAEALGWTAQELFGLHPVPERPAPNFQRLSRYDSTGLIWLMQDRSVVALTATTAAIQHPSGNVSTYYKLNKPAFGPLGDSLDDMVGASNE